MKKRLHISECTDVNVLAEDIMNCYGAVVLPAGTNINEYIIQKLAELGIEHISVSVTKKMDELSYADYDVFEKKYQDNIKEVKQLVHELIRGKRLDCTVLKKITNSVIASKEEPEQIIKFLGKLREADDYTYSHCVNVSFYAMLIAGWLNLTREDIRFVVQAALLHDLGKAKIPYELLNKKEKLSAKEFEEIKRHVIYGYEMVKDISQIPEEVKNAILMHHEREDRSGYPLFAGGDELSIYTKIISVADVYDAMTSNRSYKKALTPFEAFEEFLTVCRGAMNMHIVNTMLYNLSRYYTGSKVMLSNEQTGYIAYIPPHCVYNPIIATGSGFLDLSRERDISIISMI